MSLGLSPHGFVPMFMEDDLLYKTSKDGLMVHEEMRDDDKSRDVTTVPACIAVGDALGCPGGVADQTSSRVITPEVNDTGEGDASWLERAVNLEGMLDNPSIQIYPQHCSQVNLHAVQNMSQVFDDMYGVEDRGRRRSVRLSERPKRDFTQYR